MTKDGDSRKSKEEETAEKIGNVPSNSQHVQPRPTNSSLFANVKINESSSLKKNGRIAHQKKSDEQDKSVLRALTSPGGRSPEVLNIPICKKAAKSKSEGQVSRADMVTVTIKSTVSLFKPMNLVMKKTTSIRVLKNYLQSRLGGTHQIILIHENKELKNEGGSLASFGITSGSVLWLLVKPIAGNNDREEIASLIRMSHSLANLRNFIRSLPSNDTCEPKFSGSSEYVQDTPSGYKEAEHEQMREKMKLLMQRRVKVRRNNRRNLSENEQHKIQEIPPKNAHESSIIFSPSISTQRSTADIVKQKELATYFDPSETIKQRKFEEEELFDVPSNEDELLKIKVEMKNKRCGLCRIKLQIADREIHCVCGHVFCSKHRCPQIHRCSIDFKSVNRVHIRTALPKLVQDTPKSKI